MTNTVLMLVRHGETPANLEGIWHGSIDSPLTERGLLQAERVAAHVADRFPDVAAVYASHLQRARRTAQAIAEATRLGVRVDAGLGEYHLGTWEGKTYRELFRQQRLLECIREDPDFAPHGGESPRQVAERISGAAEQLTAGAGVLTARVNRETLPKLDRVLDEIGRSSRSLERLVDELSARPSSLVFGKPSPPPGPGEPGFVHGAAR